MLARLPRGLSFEHVVGISHAAVELAMTHLALRAHLEMDDAQVLLEMVCLVAEVHPVKTRINRALEAHALLA